MRSFAEFIIPLLIVGLGYLGIQKLATSARWSFFVKLLLHSAASCLLVAILLYEYFDRPIIDKIREAVGSAVCRYYILASCPPLIKMQVAEEEVQRHWQMASELKKQGKLREADEMEQTARELARRASELRNIAEEKRSLAAVGAVVRDRSVVGVALGRGGVVGEYAIQHWSDAAQGGEAILKFNRDTRQWTLLDLGGGAWDVDGLVTLGVPRETARALFAKVPITAMDREPQAKSTDNRPK